MLTLCLSLLLMITNSQITDKKEEVMKFELIQLPYANDGLEPVISKQTIDFHYGKHLLNYVNTLNKLIEGTNSRTLRWSRSFVSLTEPFSTMPAKY